MINKLWICLVLYCLLLSFPSEAGQKKSWKFVPTPEYKEACRLNNSGYDEEAIAKYREIANNNPGTALENKSKNLPWLNLPGLILQDEGLARHAWHIQYEPNSVYLPGVMQHWRDTSNNLSLRITYGSFDNIELAHRIFEKNAWYGVVSRHLAISSLTGEAIGDECRSEYSGQIPSRAENIVASSTTIFRKGTYVVWIHVQSDKPIDLPSIDSVAKSVEAKITTPDNIFDRYGLTPTGVDKTPPTIKTITPEYNNVYLIWRRPIIRVFMYDGDINQSQIDLANLEFKLDGVDLKDKMKTKIVTLRPRSPRDAKKIFEKIFIWYRPEKPLSRGVHTIVVNAKDYAGNSSSAMCTFKITTPRKAGEDVEEDDPSWIDRILKEFNDK